MNNRITASVASASASASVASASAERVAGLSLVLGALGFVLVFSVLSKHMGYPDVLEHPAAEVLPLLAQGGAALRRVWGAYAALPLSISLAALLLHRWLAARVPLAHVFTTSGTLAGILMSLGLVRWSTLHHALASAWVTSGDTATRASLAAVFDGANLLLGTLLGEVAGELLFAAWLFGVARALARSLLRGAVFTLSVLMFVGALRHVVPAAAIVTEVTNLLLPAVLVWLGASRVARGAARASVAALLAVTVCTLAPLTARAEPLPGREVMVHAFRSPSIGVELRDGWLGFHVGAYPTIVDAPGGRPRTTWFVKSGLTAYLYNFDAGSGRPSSPFVSVALLQGLNHDWNVSHDVTRGSAFSAEVGFRWAAYEGLDLRLGAALLVGFDGRVRVNPTPGLSWAVAF